MVLYTFVSFDSVLINITHHRENHTTPEYVYIFSYINMFVFNVVGFLAFCQTVSLQIQNVFTLRSWTIYTNLHVIDFYAFYYINCVGCS